MNFSDEVEKKSDAKEVNTFLNTKINSPIFKKYLVFLPPIIALIASWQLLNAKFSTIDDSLIFSLFQNFSFVDIFFIPGDIVWYRPVVDILFYLEYLVWGSDPFGYHLTSLFLHLIITMLVYVLSGQLFHDRKEKDLIAITSSLFFAVHPIHLETIAWISARADLLSSFFFISALIFFLSTIRAKTRGGKLLCCLLSIFFYVLGLFSKETVIIFLPCLFSHFFFISLKPERRSYEKKKHYEKLRSLIPIALILITTTSFLSFKGLAIKGADAGSVIVSLYLRHTVLPYLEDPDFVTAFFHSLIPFLNFLGALGFYIKKFFFPAPLIPTIFSISEELYLLPGLFLFAIPGYLLFKHRGITSFLLLSGFLSIVPAFPIAYTSLAWTHFSERYLYLPSVFFCIVFGFWFTKIYGAVKQKKFLIAVFVIFLIIEFTYLRQKTTIWQNSISICERIIKTNPKSPIGYESLGVYYLGENNYEKAKINLTKSIEVGGIGSSYFFLGKLALKNGDREKALDLMKKSTGLQSGKWNYFASIGDIYIEKYWQESNNRENIERAIAYYKKAIKLNPKIPSVKYRLAKAYFESGDNKMASVSARKLLLEHGDTIWGQNAFIYTK